MSKVTLNTPESRIAEVPVEDVAEVRIVHPVCWDQEVPRISFRYAKGHLNDGAFVADSTSNLVTISGADYTSYVATTPSSPTETIQSNLERRLLQYLLDKQIIATGTIS